MAWNNNSKPATPVKKQRPPVLRGLIAGMTACACIGVAVWYFNRSEPEPVKQVEKPKRVKPKVMPKIEKKPRPVVTNEVVVTNKWPARSPHKDGEWRHGEGPRSIAVTNGCLVTYPHCPGVQLILPHPAFAAPFKTLLDNEIARVLSIRAGEDVIDAPLPRNFDEKFMESLSRPIEIEEGDTPEKIELKQKVIEARKVLLEAAKRGESPREILTEEIKTLRKMMQTRDNYQRIVNEQIQSGASDQEIAEIVNAANAALQREGVEAKVVMPFKIKMRMRRAEKAKQEQ